MTAAGVVVATAGIALVWPHQRTAPTGDRPGLSCVLALPEGPAQVQIRMLDGGAPAGLLDTTVADLRARGFNVLNGTTDDNPAGVAALRYGPTAIGAATLLHAELRGEVAMRFDPDRRDGTVDLILGSTFERLATATETNQNLVAAGEPSAPPQCSIAASRPPGR